VLTRDAEVFLEIQEELLLRIIDIVEASGTAVSLPSGTAPVAKNPDGSSITGPVLARFSDMPADSRTLPILRGGVAGTADPNSFDTSEATLTRRSAEEGAVIPMSSADTAVNVTSRYALKLYVDDQLRRIPWDLAVYQQGAVGNDRSLRTHIANTKGVTRVESMAFLRARFPEGGEVEAQVEAHNVTVRSVEYRGGAALEVRRSVFGAAPDIDTFAFLPSFDFHNGTIEVEVAGSVLPDAPAGARGFVGVVFRVETTDGSFACEGIYLRPTNGRADDQVRRNHSTQYFAYPGYDFARLRREEPAKYESYVDLIPGEWTLMRVEVKDATA
jgi:hypothetical protein